MVHRLLLLQVHLILVLLLHLLLLLFVFQVLAVFRCVLSDLSLNLEIQIILNRIVRNKPFVGHRQLMALIQDSLDLI